MGRIELLLGDITGLDVDAIVNAANTSLSGGGGVDGAIHRRAGPELLAECRTLGCPTGEARMTRGYRLPARHVIHVAGPRWHGGGRGEEALLEKCYENALSLAVRHGVRTIAFPCISTGVYGYPIDQAAPVAVRAVRQGLRTAPSLERVVLVCFSRPDFECYQSILKG
ncbi:MAG TPA: O-acetyl-ADP-ribose deacetylase [Elusimicrobiota bacterium]|nr:O-acetyl-ADP-ribose deacetylase [Elusimicrobiota bacterium]